jgi:hypothetical protein
MSATPVTPHTPPIRFYLKGVAALVVLFLATLLMTPAPEVNALRGVIAGGLVIVCVKMLLRHYKISWPAKGPRRH